MKNELIARLKQAARDIKTVLHIEDMEIGSIRKMGLVGNAVDDAIEALSRPMTNDNKPSAALGLEVAQELHYRLEYEAEMHTHIRMLQSRIADSERARHGAVRAGQQRAAPVVVDAEPYMFPDYSEPPEIIVVPSVEILRSDLKAWHYEARSRFPDSYEDQMRFIAESAVRCFVVRAHAVKGAIVAFSCAKRCANPAKSSATCKAHCGDHDTCMASYADESAPPLRQSAPAATAEGVVVAFRYRAKESQYRPWQYAEEGPMPMNAHGFEVEPLYTHPPKPEADKAVAADGIAKWSDDPLTGRRIPVPQVSASDGVEPVPSQSAPAASQPDQGRG